MTEPAQIDRVGIDSWPKRGSFLHCAVFVAGRPPLSTETFRLVSFSGQESVSQPFRFQLELHANTDPDGKDPVRFKDSAHEQLNLAELVGRPVTVGIDEPITDAERERHKDYWGEAIAGRAVEHLSVFNGIVASFSLGAPGVYHLTMQPALWRLTLTNAYRVHRGKNIVDAIGDLLKAHKVDHSLDAVSGTDNPAVTRVQDWLQAGESDFEFVQRLMAKANIYYYFEHSATAHKLVFANRPNYPEAYPDSRLLRYTHSSAETLGMEQDDVITDYRYSHSLVSSGVCGALVRQEAAWEKDSVADAQTYQASSAPELGELPFYRYQVCQYGGGKDEAAWGTGRVNESLTTSATELSGASHCVRFRCAHQFRLANARFNGREVRPGLSTTAFVLTEVQHTADIGGGYSNQFRATEAQGLITPFSLHDTQQGVVLAQVVRHDNGSAPRDWRYYQKINFDPEQEGVSQSDSRQATLRAKGVYVRFVTDGPGAEPVWVKLAPHMQTVPEIGVIVQVTRANDLTELPEIQSIVQNNGNRVVTPSGWTASTNVGSSYSTSYGDSKSVRFGLSSVADLDSAVDKVTAKYASGQYRDVSYSQGGSYSYSTAEGGRAGLLSDSESLGSTYSRHQGEESKNWSDVGYSYSKQKVGHTDSYTTIDGKSYSESRIGESENHSDIKGDSKSYTNIGGDNYSDATIGSSTSFATINGKQFSKSTVNGPSETINTVSGHSSSATHLTTSSSVTTIAAQTSSAAIGATNSNSATGASNSNNATGVSVNVSAAGMTNDVSAVGMANQVSVVGMQNKVEILGAVNSFTNKPASTDTKIESLQVNIVLAVQLVM